MLKYNNLANPGLSQKNHSSKQFWFTKNVTELSSLTFLDIVLILREKGCSVNSIIIVHEKFKFTDGYRVCKW